MKRTKVAVSRNAHYCRLRTFELIEVNKEWSIVKYSLMKLSMLNSWYAVVFWCDETHLV